MSFRVAPAIAVLAASLASAQCELAKVTAQDAALGDQFGYSVAVDGTTALVGARFDDGAASGSGAVYVFELIGVSWVETAKWTASDAEGGAGFGFAVDLEGDTALVGANNDDAGLVDAGAVYVFERVGGVWIENAKLTGSDAVAGDHFGEAVELAGDFAFVGPHRGDLAVEGPGAVWVFERDDAGTPGDPLDDSWPEVQALLSSDAQDEDHFGLWSSVSGDTLLVGTRNDDLEGVGEVAGSAYVFEREAGVWTEKVKLTASDAEAGDYFGECVQLAGDTALVGASHTIKVGPGAVYVFERSGTNWIEVQKLTASDAANGDRFGQRLSLSGDALVVGAHRDDDAGASSGAAYLFERTGGVWSETAKLTAEDGQAGDFLGLSVALSGDTVWLGAGGDDDAAPAAGAAYVFSRTGSAFVSLAGSPGVVSLVAGGTQVLELGTCSDSAGDLYLLLGTASGTSPGISAAGLNLPLNPDPYFLATLTLPNAPPLVASLGVLDAAASAQAAVVLPAGLDPTLAGITLHHAYAVLELPSVAASFVSGAVPLVLVN